MDKSIKLFAGVCLLCLLVSLTCAQDCPADCVDQEPPDSLNSCDKIANELNLCGTSTTRGDRYCKCSCQTCPGMQSLNPSPSQPSPTQSSNVTGWIDIDGCDPRIGCIESTIQGDIFIANPANPGTAIGLTTGGAQGVASFRRDVENGIVPTKADLTYEGLFSEYAFDVEDSGQCTDWRLLCAKYSGAISEDPFYGSMDQFLAIGFEASLGFREFERNKLNLVIVLDVSGSMGTGFGDFEGITEEERSLKKFDVAQQAIKSIINQLNTDDTFGIVTFGSSSRVALQPESVTTEFAERAKNVVDTISVGGGTNLEAGLTTTFDLMRKDNERDNRMIIITDANANMGEYSAVALAQVIDQYATGNKEIFTSLIGIGLDFNAAFTEEVLRTKGANYFSVYSPSQMRQKLDDEFAYMVTPMIYDLKLQFEKQDLENWEVIQAFGVPDNNVNANGTIVQIKTLFPAPTTEQGTKGGIILLQLKNKGDIPADLTIKIEYNLARRNNDGRQYQDTVEIFSSAQNEFYGSNAIRKAILLARYVRLLREILPDNEGGELTIDAQYENQLFQLVVLMIQEKSVLGDENLQKDIDVLQKLIRSINS